jgi:hypothetical protein
MTFRKTVSQLFIECNYPSASTRRRARASGAHRHKTQGRARDPRLKRGDRDQLAASGGAHTITVNDLTGNLSGQQIGLTLNDGAGNDVFIWNRAMAATLSMASQASTSWRSTAPTPVSTSTCGQATLFCDVGAVIMHLNSVEHIDLSASGGADSITVNHLTGTAVKQVAMRWTPSFTISPVATDPVGRQQIL